MLSFSPRKVIFAFYLWSFGSFFSCFSCFSRFVSILRFFFLLLFFLFFSLNLLSPSIREASLNFLLLSRVPIIFLPRIHSRPLFTRSFNTSLSRLWSRTDLLPSSTNLLSRVFCLWLPSIFFLFSFLNPLSRPQPRSSYDNLYEFALLSPFSFSQFVPQRIPSFLFSPWLWPFLNSLLPPFFLFPFSHFTFAFCPRNFDPPLSLSLVNPLSPFLGPPYPGNQEPLFIEPASGRLINGVHGVCREIRIYNGAIPAREGSATTRLRVPASFDPRLVGRWTEFDWRDGNDREHESLWKLGENSLIDTFEVLDFWFEVSWYEVLHFRNAGLTSRNLCVSTRFGEKVFLLRRGMMIDRQPAKILCSVEDIEKAWMERIGSKTSWIHVFHNVNS